MNILLWILFGGIAGWVASIFTGTNHNMIEEICIGIIGGFIGGFLMNFFGEHAITGFNLYSIFVAIVGSVVFIVLARVLRA